MVLLIIQLYELRSNRVNVPARLCREYLNGPPTGFRLGLNCLTLILSASAISFVETALRDQQQNLLLPRRQALEQCPLTGGVYIINQVCDNGGLR